jgi:transcriptional regulator with GAF, ATPase, and Fis domain
VSRTGDVAVVVARAELSDMSGVKALSLVADVAAAVRRVLAMDELTEDVKRGLDAGKVHATVPMEETLLAVAVRDALERRVLDAELEQLRRDHEDRVAERTGQLEMKIRELEGRSRIAQHLLRVHTMDGTLEEVLKVLTQTLSLERAVVHLAQGNHLHPSAAIRLHDHEEAEVYDPGEVESSPLVRQTLEQARSSRQSQNVIDPQTPFVSPFAVVPILREDELLGLIEVENFRSQRSITEAEIEVLTNLAVEVAVAIQDVRYHESFERWKHQLEQILTEVDRVDSFGEDSPV